MLHTSRTGWFIAVQVRSASTDDGGKAGNDPSLEQVILYSQLECICLFRSCFGFHSAVGCACQWRDVAAGAG